MGDPRSLHGTGPASEWVLRWAPLVKAGSRVLDVASGAGRHSRLFSHMGCEVTAVDRDERALQMLAEVPHVRPVAADIEAGPWPLPGEQFDAIIITHYLWRPLWPTLLSSVAPAGLLVVETFALGHERLGRPSNPDFLLKPGELMEVASELHVLAYEDGLLDDPPRRMQRIAARRPLPDEPAADLGMALHPAR